MKVTDWIDKKNVSKIHQHQMKETWLAQVDSNQYAWYGCIANLIQKVPIIYEQTHFVPVWKENAVGIAQNPWSFITIKRRGRKLDSVYTFAWMDLSKHPLPTDDSSECLLIIMFASLPSRSCQLRQELYMPPHCHLFNNKKPHAHNHSWFCLPELHFPGVFFRISRSIFPNRLGAFSDFYSLRVFFWISSPKLSENTFLIVTSMFPNLPSGREQRQIHLWNQL